ncbi:Transposon Ty3-G Gag-Pol poly, partial [Paramuricea clavata]
KRPLKELDIAVIDCESPKEENGIVEKLPSPGLEPMRKEPGTLSPAKHQPETSKPVRPQRCRHSHRLLKSTDIRARDTTEGGTAKRGGCYNSLNENTQRTLNFNIIHGDYQPVLSLDTSIALAVVNLTNCDILALTIKPPEDNSYVAEEYADVFDGLGEIPGAHTITIEDTAKPVIHAPRRVPVALRSQIKAKLDELVDRKVIVPVTEPTRWVSSMLAVVKPNKIRICIDPRDLNRVIRREHYQLPTVDEVTSRLTGAKKFTLCDAKDGFHQIKLDTASSYLTTFNSPFGRYRWTRMPFGISSAPEVWQRRMHEFAQGLNGVEVIADDFLIAGFGETGEEVDRSLETNERAFFKKCREWNLKLNKSKLKRSQTEVRFMGHLITADGLKADPAKVEAILDMPAPTDTKGLKRFLGMVNYLAKFLPLLSDMTEPLRRLEDKDVEWCWLEQHQQAYDTVKKSLAKAPVLRYYDVSKEVTIECDASDTGLGAVLTQDGQPKPSPKRLQRMLLALQNYNLNVQYKKGKLMWISDTLSRAYRNTTESWRHDTTEVRALEEIDHAENLSISPDRLDQFKRETPSDKTMQSIIVAVKNGWPTSKRQCSQDLAPFYDKRSELVVDNGLVFAGERLVVPKSMRKEMLTQIHRSHIGIEGCLRRAREAYQPAQCHHWSGFFEVQELTRTTADKVIVACKVQFARHGIPDTVITDNGPQFSATEFSAFARDWQFKHLTSSPRYPQSNGRAENAVKTCKMLMTKAKAAGQDPLLAFLDWRNTPTEGLGSSPAQRLMGRRTRTLLPTHKNLLKQPINEGTRDKLAARKSRQIRHYNKTHHPLKPLKKGQAIRMKLPNATKWTLGTCTRVLDNRSYEVEVSGRKYRRNRRQLRASQERPPTPPAETISKISSNAINYRHTANKNKAMEQVQSDNCPSENDLIRFYKAKARLESRHIFCIHHREEIRRSLSRLRPTRANDGVIA